MSNAWFPFYPGDYGRKTAHLSVIENGAYLLLLIHYYATSRPLPVDLAAIYRIARAHDGAERAAVDSVLAQFFILRGDGYHNDRTDSELGKRSEFHNKLSAAGRKRWHKPGTEPGSSQALRQPESRAIASPQPQPQPQPQKQKKKSAADAALVELPDWLPRKEWNDYLKMRKRIRRDATPEAVTLAIRELEKLKAAGSDPKLVLEQSILNSWQGLFELRVDFNAVRTAERNRDAIAGKLDPGRPVKEQSAEEQSEMEHMRIESERWDELEKGTLPVNPATVAWVKAKQERLRRVRTLPAADPRPRMLGDFLRRAATPEQLPACTQ